MESRILETFIRRLCGVAQMSHLLNSFKSDCEQIDHYTC